MILTSGLLIHVAEDASAEIGWRLRDVDESMKADRCLPLQMTF
jgi:hypothetical protein